MAGCGVPVCQAVGAPLSRGERCQPAAHPNELAFGRLECDSHERNDGRCIRQARPNRCGRPTDARKLVLRAGYHVRAGDAEEHNLDTWTEVRRWLGSQDKPILADPRDVLTRLYNSEINGCVAEVPEGSYIVALGDEHNGFDAEGRAESLGRRAPMARGTSSRVLSEKPVHHSNVIAVRSSHLIGFFFFDRRIRSETMLRYFKNLGDRRPP